LFFIIVVSHCKSSSACPVVSFEKLTLRKATICGAVRSQR